MKMSRAMIVAGVLGALAFLPGCAILQGDGSEGEEFAVRSSIQLATVKVIDGDQERAERVVEIASQARELVAGDSTAALDEVEQRVRDEIQWDTLSPAEQQVASDLVELVRAELEARIGEGALDPEDRVAVRTVLDWIIEAAGRAAGEDSSALAHQTVDRENAVLGGRETGPAHAATPGSHRRARAPA